MHPRDAKNESKDEKHIENCLPMLFASDNNIFAFIKLLDKITLISCSMLTLYLLSIFCSMFHKKPNLLQSVKSLWYKFYVYGRFSVKKVKMICKRICVDAV